LPKKALIFLLIFGFAAGAVFAQDKKFKFSLIGGISSVFEYGSAEDYSLGENDFPVTPSHMPPYFGLSFSYFFANNVRAELDWRYVLSSKIVLSDPSDNDTIEIDTSKQYFASLNIVYQYLPFKFRPYVLVGGGINKLLAEAGIYISEFGYEIEWGIPYKTTALFAQFGGGLDVPLSLSFGVLADVRFVYLFTEQNDILSLFAGIGAYFLF